MTSLLSNTRNSLPDLANGSAGRDALAEAINVQFRPEEIAALQDGFAQALPLVLLSVLERRHLYDVDSLTASIAARPGDTGRPLLREVVSLGRPENTEVWSAAMPHVFSACHVPGHSLVLLLHGTRGRHRLFLGGRRVIGSGARSTEDYLDSQASALKAHIGGLRLGDLKRLDAEESPDTTAFLESAPSLAAVTGIPSGRGPGGLPVDTQSLDRLVKAVGGGQYALVAIAEPIDAEQIDATIDACRRLQSEVHAYVRRTVGRSSGGGDSASRTESEETSQSQTKGVAGSLGSMLPVGINGVTQLVSAAGQIATQVAQSRRQEAGAQTQQAVDQYQALHPGQKFSSGAVQLAIMEAGAKAVGPVLGALTVGFPLLSAAVSIGGAALTTYVSKTQQATAGKSQNVTESKSWGESGSVELLDANAAFCEKLLEEHIVRLQTAKSTGWWQTSVYIAGENEATVHAVSGALRSLCAGPGTALEPMRVHFLPPHVLRDAVLHGKTLSLTPREAGESATHPLGAPFETLGTCLHSGEAAVLFNVPRAEIPGLPLRDLTDFSLSAPSPAPGTVALGNLLDSLGRPLAPVAITESALNRHTFITGMTGYGKSNTAMQLLYETYQTLGVPFLVIEPAKAEYRLLAQIPELQGQLRVYSVGGATGLAFRLNPLAPVPGIPLSRHVDLLKAVFNASFPMYAGMPYVLEEAIIEVYRERGWSLAETDNPYLGPRATIDERSALTPSLEDLYEKIEVTLKRRNYGQEVHQNMGAALRSRLKSLMMGNKGTVFNTRRSTPLRDLFEGPCVIELKNLGDDEEKAFVMALLFTFLYEYAEVRQRNIPVDRRGKRLQHLTLIEEAHRLLTATHGTGGTSETGDPRGKAVTMFTDMLAEMRAYGEGFVIADQIPTKLAPETLKNSNLKIVHRLAAPDDRQVTGACLNLSEAQIKHLNSLGPGEAVVHDERLGEAALVQIVNFKDLRAPFTDEDELEKIISSQEVASPLSLMRDGGCHACPAPCRFFPRLRDADAQETAALASGLRRLWECLVIEGSNSVARAWEEWRAWQNSLIAEAPSLTAGMSSLAGITYCAATRMAHDWLGDVFKARGALWGRADLSPEDRIGRERAARALGTLVIAWIENDETPLTEKSEEAFTTARDVVLSTAFAAPPRDRDGCLSCPARCRVLPFVAGYQPALQAAVQGHYGKRRHVAEIVATLEQTVVGAQATPLIPLLARRPEDERLHHDWLYCLVTNTPPAPAGDAAQALMRRALLEQLRTDAPSVGVSTAPPDTPSEPVADPLLKWRQNLV